MVGERRFTRLQSGEIHFRGPVGDDEAIAALATEQHGVAGRSQLLELGITGDAIDCRISIRRLWPVHPGAYAGGHVALTYTARALAAVIATRPGSVASHWTAAILHSLTDRIRPLIHVTNTKARRGRAGLLIHRGVLPADEIVAVGGVPTTSIPRLLLDLSAERDERGLRTLIKRAEFKGLIRPDDIHAILARYPGRRGRGTLARITRGYALHAGRTLSPIEDDFIEFCGDRDIPLPKTNVPIWAAGRERVVDCL